MMMKQGKHPISLREGVCRKPIREKPQVVESHEGESTDALHRDGATRSSDEVRESGWSKGVALPALENWSTEKEEPK